MKTKAGAWCRLVRIPGGRLGQIGGWEDVVDKAGNRVPCSVSVSVTVSCEAVGLQSRGVSRIWFLLLLLLLFRAVAPWCPVFFVLFVFLFVFATAMRFRVAALASGFILPTSLSAMWLVLWVLQEIKSLACVACREETLEGIMVIPQAHFRVHFF